DLSPLNGRRPVFVNNLCKPFFKNCLIRDIWVLVPSTNFFFTIMQTRQSFSCQLRGLESWCFLFCLHVLFGRCQLNTVYPEIIIPTTCVFSTSANRNIWWPVISVIADQSVRVNCFSEDF